MEILFVLSILIIPFGTGIALFLYLPRKEAVLPWQLYTTLRGLVFSLLLMPTFIVGGDGGMVTDTLAGSIAVIVFGGAHVEFRDWMFGKAGGFAIFLQPCVVGLGLYIVIFVLDVFIHHDKTN